MTPQELAILRSAFQLRVHQASGQAFEDFFCAILEKARTGFRRVKAQGKLGDRKNDGYIKTEGEYYQVYAPQNPEAQSSVTTSVKKAAEDFEGLKSYWSSFCPVKHYRFVFNDKFSGAYPELEKTLASIKEEHGLESAEVFLAKDLEDAFFSLSDDQMMFFLGNPPNPIAFSQLEYPVLNEILASIIEDTGAISADDLNQVPDFDKKLSHNDFSEGGKSLLVVGGYQIGALDHYFGRNSKFTRTQIEIAVSEIYRRACKKIDELKVATSHRGDLILLAMQDMVVVKPTGPQQAAIFTLFAFYFETCDIFEEPPA